MLGPEEWPSPFTGYRNRLTVDRPNSGAWTARWIPRILATLGTVLRIWSRLQSSLDIGMRQQVTRLGLLFTMACVLVALGAFASANNLLFLILAVMLATFMVSGFISRLSLAGLELDFVLPDHISAHRKLLGRIVIRNSKGWMPSFSIHLTASGDSGLSFPLYFPVI